MTTVQHLSQRVWEDLGEFCPDLYKSPREKLATLVAVAVESSTCNLMEWAARLPIATSRMESRYAWVERFFQAETLDEDAVMRPFARQICAHSCQRGQTLVLCMDQTSIGNTHGILTLSLRVGNRGLPLFWRVKQTAGNIGITEQKELLEQVDTVLPEGAKVLFLGDRFFGTAALVKACQQRNWSYALRLKGNLTLAHEGGELTTSEVATIGGYGIENAELYGTGVKTNIGVLHEKGHKEPWILAMSDTPTRASILDYGLRWSIENMFSDFKTRGFGLEDTHLQRPERVARLVLVLALAMHWAVIAGTALLAQKNARPKAPAA